TLRQDKRFMAIMRSLPLRPLLFLVPLTGAVVWAYWPTLCRMAAKWSEDPQYSQGYLVPAFSIALLWLRRQRLAHTPLDTNWWGVVPLLAGVTARLAGTLFYIEWLEAVSLLPVLAGAALLLGGVPALRWSWPAIGFLVFMIPLPYRVETSLAQPLRTVATRA